MRPWNGCGSGDYPDVEKHPHPALAEAVIVDLVTGKTRRDGYLLRMWNSSLGGAAGKANVSINFVASGN